MVLSDPDFLKVTVDFCKNPVSLIGFLTKPAANLLNSVNLLEFWSKIPHFRLTFCDRSESSVDFVNHIEPKFTP